MAMTRSGPFVFYLIVITILFNCCRDPQDEVLKIKLKARINEYFTYFFNEEYEKAWFIIRPEQRRETWPEETWVNVQRQNNGKMKLESMKILKIKMLHQGQRTGAIVDMRFKTKKILENGRVLAEEWPWEDGWSYENGEWYRLEHD